MVAGWSHVYGLSVMLGIHGHRGCMETGDAGRCLSQEPAPHPAEELAHSRSGSRPVSFRDLQPKLGRVQLLASSLVFRDDQLITDHELPDPGPQRPAQNKEHHETSDSSLIRNQSSNTPYLSPNSHPMSLLG